jgi:hypothetical protein
VTSEEEEKEFRVACSMRWLYSLRGVVVVAEEGEVFRRVKLRLRRYLGGSGDTIVVA